MNHITKSKSAKKKKKDKKKNPSVYQIPDGWEAIGGKIKSYPNQTQKTQLYQAFGSGRFVWNHFKTLMDKRHEMNPKQLFPKSKYLMRMLTNLKKDPKYAWLKLSDSTALQLSLHNYIEAQFSFMTGKSGEPKFKCRRYYRQSLTMRNNKVSYIRKSDYQKIVKETIQIVDKHHIRVPKLGLIRCKDLSYLRGMRILRATITWREDNDFFWISLNGIRPKKEPYARTGKAVGIDLGLGNEWLKTSDGQSWSVPDTQALEKKKRELQSKMDRRKNQAVRLAAQYNKSHTDKIDKYNYKNWQKCRHTLSLVNMKMHDKREDDIQKITAYLVKHYDLIVIEDLQVSNLMKNHKLARAIANASWARFRQVLAYKCKMYGKKLIVVPPAYTSRICSNCGKKNPAFQHMSTNQWLSVREWECPFCHAHLDRDINAAKNILKRGLKQLVVQATIAK